MLTQTKMNRFNESFVVTPTASVAADTETQFLMKDKHWKYVLIGTCASNGQLTFSQGDSAFAGGDLVIPIKTGTFAITVEDGLVKTTAPVTISSETYTDVVTFKSSVALTNVMVIKLP